MTKRQQTKIQQLLYSGLTERLALGACSLLEIALYDVLLSRDKESSHNRDIHRVGG